MSFLRLAALRPTASCCPPALPPALRNCPRGALLLSVPPAGTPAQGLRPGCSLGQAGSAARQRSPRSAPVYTLQMCAVPKLPGMTSSKRNIPQLTIPGRLRTPEAFSAQKPAVEWLLDCSIRGREEQRLAEGQQEEVEQLPRVSMVCVVRVAAEPSVGRLGFGLLHAHIEVEAVTQLSWGCVLQPLLWVPAAAPPPSVLLPGAATCLEPPMPQAMGLGTPAARLPRTLSRAAGGTQGGDVSQRDCDRLERWTSAS